MSHRGFEQPSGQMSRTSSRPLRLIGQVEDDVARAHGHGALGVETTRRERRLQSQARHHVGVIEREAQKISELAVVQTRDHGHGEHHLDAHLAATLDGAQLDVEDVAAARRLYTSPVTPSNEVHA